MERSNINTIFRLDRKIAPYLNEINSSFGECLGKTVIIHIIDLIDKDMWTDESRNRLKELYNINDDFVDAMLDLIVKDYNTLYLNKIHGYWYNGECYVNSNLEKRINVDA